MHTDVIALAESNCVLMSRYISIKEKLSHLWFWET